MLRWLLVLVMVTLCSGCVVRALLRGGPHADSFDTSARGYCWDCVGKEDLKRELARERTNPRTLGPAGPNHVHVDRERTVKTRATYEGGHFVLIGRPTRSREQAVLSLRPLTKLGPLPCEARLFRDGSEIAVRGIARKSDRELLVLLDVAALRGLDESGRFSGRVCDAEFSFGDAARATVGQFERRFREELAQLPAE